MKPLCVESAPLSSLSAEDYQQLQAAPLTGPFHLPALLNMWPDILHWPGKVLRCGHSLIVGYTRKSPLGTHFYSLPFGMYAHSSLEISAMETAAFSSWLHDRRFAEIRIVAPAPRENCPPWSLKSRALTFHLLNLDPAVDYSDHTVRNLRKAAAPGFTVARLAKADTVFALRILREHQHRTGEIRRLPDSAYEYLLDQSTIASSGIMSAALFSAGRLLAVQLYFVTKTDAFYFDGFSLADALPSRGNFFLMDAMIREFRAQGLPRLNFGASPPNDAGLRRFKEGWGALALPATEFYHTSAKKKLVDLLRGRR